MCYCLHPFHHPPFPHGLVHETRIIVIIMLDMLLRCGLTAAVVASVAASSCKESPNQRHCASAEDPSCCSGGVAPQSNCTGLDQHDCEFHLPQCAWGTSKECPSPSWDVSEPETRTPLGNRVSAYSPPLGTTVELNSGHFVSTADGPSVLMATDYWCAGNNDNAVLASKSSVATVESKGTYTATRPSEDTVLANSTDQALPLQSFWSEAMKDTLTTASEKGLAFAKAHGYTAGSLWHMLDLAFC